jgi:hypothetical protein
VEGVIVEWTVPFVIFRPKEGGQYEEVFQTSDFKKAKYWLTYIAEVGDVLCRTPNHPKYGGTAPIPEYWSHKVSAGTLETDKKKFIKHSTANDKSFFPEAPSRSADSYQD